VSITGLTITTGSSLNLSNQTITTASATQFTVTNATVGTAAATQAGIATIQSAGNSVTITAGNASGTGAGGSLILQAGLQATSGGDGKVIVKQVSGQTSNLQEWQNSSGTALAYINASGALTAPINGLREKTTVSATAATGTINYDYLTQSVLYYTTNSSGNFTLNVRGDGTTALNSIMNTGDTITLAFLVTNGSPAFYQTAMQIDGTAVTPKWQGGTAPSSGNASAIDSYTYTIIKTASATYTVLAAQTKYA
jgi:hypothetical protein